MSLLIRRSTLILPVNIPRFVEKAHLRGADAIIEEELAAINMPNLVFMGTSVASGTGQAGLVS